MRSHRLRDHLRNGGKSDAAVEEAGDGDLIRSVQHDGEAACRLERTIGEAQTGKRIRVGSVKLQWTGLYQIE